VNFLKVNNRAFIFAIIFTIVVTMVATFVYYSLTKWENELVEKKKLVCEMFVGKLHDHAIESFNIFGENGLLLRNDLNTMEIKFIDEILKSISEEQLSVQTGLEGGFYLVGADEFYGYAYPSSPPPIPIYGPPPRSYKIIKDQALQTINDNQLIINLHSFQPAIFPLATTPILYNDSVVGVVWVRTHIENELPIIKLKQIVNIAAILSILGFFILMLVSSLWRGEIQGIKMELKNIQSNPDFRLRPRVGIFGYITTNINEMLETLAEDNRQQQALEQQLIQKEKLASLGKMIAGVAHEVKTPLAIIKTRIQMWQQTVKTNQQVGEFISPESMQLVIDETNRLSNLVKRLLIFTRPIEKNMKQTSINQLIDEVVCFIILDKSDNRISIVKNLSPDIPLILTDVNSLKQVFINVISNSIEAMPDGGVITITTGFDKEANGVSISINDTGTGIPEDIINNIFDPFFTSKDSGAGLGLSISYEIVKLHHGEIVFTNNIDCGANCLITLPKTQ